MARVPRSDSRGIVDPAALFARVRFRRHPPAEPLHPYVEHYWLIDWDLDEPYTTHVVPHPSVNLVFQRYADDLGGGGNGDEEARWPGTEPGPEPEPEPGPGYGELSGVAAGLFEKKLAGRGRVCGVQFRPGGFGPFAPHAPVSRWTGRVVPPAEVFPSVTDQGARDAAAAVLTPDADRDRVAALDRFLLRHGPPGLAHGAPPDPRVLLAVDLVDRIRRDRTICRAGDFARAHGLSARALQRLFHDRVGVAPKWVILRYRIHEALEQAATAESVDWSRLAADLGYADQAHLVRDFTATVGVPPTAYRQATLGGP